MVDVKKEERYLGSAVKSERINNNPLNTQEKNIFTGDLD